MKTDEQHVLEILARVHDELTEFATCAIVVATVDSAMLYKIVGSKSQAVGLAHFLIHEIENEWDRVQTETLPDEKGAQ